MDYVFHCFSRIILTTVHDLESKSINQINVKKQEKEILRCI